MFERFTNTARRAVVLSQVEARELKHDGIAPRHMLLGAMTAENATAGDVLAGLGVHPDAVRAQVIATYGRGDVEPADRIPFSDDAKKALEHSLRNSMELGHNHIGTAHLILGLVTGPPDDITVVFDALGVDLVAVRQSAMDRLSADEEPTEP